MILYGVADKLAASMESDQAVLLTKLYHNFFNTIIKESKNYPSLSSTKQTNSSSHCWVLSRLHSIFGESLVIICKHEKYGTLLYHKQCDQVKALSSALGKGIKYYSKDETPKSSNNSNTQGYEGVEKQIDIDTGND